MLRIVPLVSGTAAVASSTCAASRWFGVSHLHSPPVILSVASRFAKRIGLRSRKPALSEAEGDPLPIQARAKPRAPFRRPLEPCHLERSEGIRLANPFAQSKDPMPACAATGVARSSQHESRRTRFAQRLPTAPLLPPAGMGSLDSA